MVIAQTNSSSVMQKHAQMERLGSEGAIGLSVALIGVTFALLCYFGMYSYRIDFS